MVKSHEILPSNFLQSWQYLPFGKGFGLRKEFASYKENPNASKPPLKVRLIGLARSSSFVNRIHPLHMNGKVDREQTGIWHVDRASTHREIARNDEKNRHTYPSRPQAKDAQTVTCNTKQIYSSCQQSIVQGQFTNFYEVYRGISALTVSLGF